MRLPSGIGPIHIVGIGGIGMSAIAEVLHARGIAVQGSDQSAGANVSRLQAKGIPVAVGHRPENLGAARHVVISSAVKAGNPELDAARARGLTIIRRAEMLAEIMRDHATISVTGTHGKTTTTSLIAHLLTACGTDPTVINGGVLVDWGSNARLGRSPWMVVEADESDGTFARLPTEIGVVTNIDPEHLDYFGSIEAMHNEFAIFYRNIPFYGAIVTCLDHPVVRQMIDRLDLRRDGRRLLTYGTHADCDLRLAGSRIDGRMTTFDAVLSDRVRGGARRLDGLRVPMPGRHNAMNALAAFAVASEVGLADADIAAALAGFAGVERRFQLAGSWHGVEIIDDYAHNPPKIAAALHAARSCSAGRVIAVFEPHRFTRVRDLWDEFCKSFADADHVVVLPLYTAGESPIDGVTSAALAAGIAGTGHGSVEAIADPREAAQLVRQWARPGDMVIYCGAGRSSAYAFALAGELAAGGTA
jgi:UDP-N-acetylmuramate--alanine ligase